MIRFLVLAIALVFFVSVAFFFIVSALLLLALACAVGIPLYFITTSWMKRRGIGGPAQNPMERLRNLYLDDKIDLFEYERRVAQLIRVDHGHHRTGRDFWV